MSEDNDIYNSRRAVLAAVFGSAMGGTAAASNILDGGDSAQAEVDVYDILCKYTDDDNQIGTEGLRTAMDDWREYELDSDDLQEAISAWGDEEVVGDCTGYETDSI
jgi:hypothetical protein